MKHLSLLILPFLAVAAQAQTTSGSIGAYTINPPDGATLETIENVTITFSDLGFWGLDYDLDLSGVTLAAPDGPQYKVVRQGGIPDNGECIMFFGLDGVESAVATPGNYTLTIPAGSFTRYFNSSICNDLITVAYTVGGIAVNSMSVSTVTPAGTVSGGVAEVTVEFPDASSAIELAAGCETVTLTGAGLTYSCVSAECDGRLARLAFAVEGSDIPAPIQRPGDYTLSIPAKTFRDTASGDLNLRPVEATFTVDNPDFNPMAAWTVTPAPGSTVESFSQISLLFPDATRGLDFPSSLGAVTLSIDGKPTAFRADNAQLVRPYNCVKFGFIDSDYSDVSFTATGTYTVDIPAGTFSESGGAGYVSPAISLTFNLLNPEDVTPFDNLVSTPAAGATVGELCDFTLSFPDMAADRIQYPFDISRVTISRVGDDTVYVGSGTYLQGGCNVKFGFVPLDRPYADPIHFTTPGEYILTVPEGVFCSSVDNSVTNRRIELHFIVDPTYNFRVGFLPESGSVMTTLPEIILTPSDVITTLSIAGNNAGGALLRCGDSVIGLDAAPTDGGRVALTPQSPVGLGTWTLEVAAGMLSGTNPDGLTFSNPEPITATYTVAQPQAYSFTLTPAANSTVATFSLFTVAFAGDPNAIEINPEAGTPQLRGSDGAGYELRPSVSGSYVHFAVDGGAQLPDGSYTVVIPRGYIATVDSRHLRGDVAEISVPLAIGGFEMPDLSGGMLLYNEGWFGHEAASFIHVGPDGRLTDYLFQAVNPSEALGVTGTWAARYGSAIYAVAKMDATAPNGVQGSTLTAIDASTFGIIGAVDALEDGEQARAFCAVTPAKGYLSTNRGIYPVDLTDMSLGERIEVTKSFTLAYGEMLSYRGRLYVTANNWSLIVIDPADDSFETLTTGPAVTTFVAPDGSLYVATLAEGNDFLKIDPETLATEAVKIDNGGDYSLRSRVANIWSTWTPAPLAVDRTENVVYYATTTGATTVARLNLTTGEFNPAFVRLPATDSGQQALYGRGIEVDPFTGEIILTAVEQGYGAHYTQTFIYRADPATGTIIDDKTIKLSEHYWFPSMALFCGYEAPLLTLPQLDLSDGRPVELNLLDYTTLSGGNIHTVEFDITSADPAVCTVEATGPATFTLTPVSPGHTDLTVSATFMGLRSEATVGVGTSHLVAPDADSDAPVDIYTPGGILIRRNATPADIRLLPPGLYIPAPGRR